MTETPDRQAEEPRLRLTFVVSVRQDGNGALEGVVEAVRTGRKEAFRDLESLGGLIEAMVRRLRA